MNANAEIIAELRRVLNERDEAREQLDLTKRELGRWVDRETKAVRERDEARAEVERLRAEVASSLAMAKIADEKHDQKCAEVDVLRGVGCNEDGDGPCGVCRKCAYRRGAEAMREAAANALDMAGQGTLCNTSECEHWGRYVRALPIPEEP